MSGQNSQTFENQDTVISLIRFGKFFCILSILGPIVLLSLKVIDYNLFLKTSPTGHAIFNPFSALCYVALGSALWLVRRDDVSAGARKVSRALSILTLTIALSSIVSYFIKTDFDLVAYLFNLYLVEPGDPLWRSTYTNMGTITALGLVLLSLSILFIDQWSDNKLYNNPQSLNYITIFVSLIAIYGYIYKVKRLYEFIGYIPISLHSAIFLYLLSSAILFLRPYKGTMKDIIGQNPTEVFMMRFLAFIVPLVIGYIKIKGEEKNIFDQDFGTAILATCTFVISMSLLGWKSSIQYKLLITKHRRFRTIKKDRENLERILNTSQTYIQITDLKTDTLIFSNDSGEGSFKARRKEIEGKKFSELILNSTHPDDQQAVIDRRKRLANLKDNEYDDLILRLVDAENNAMWVYSRAMVYKREKGKVKEVLFNAVDITRQKLEEEELEKTVRKIKKKNKELRTARKKLEEANIDLEKEIRKHSERLYESEKRYHDFIKNSFEGILRYELKSNKKLDTSLDLEEQVEIIFNESVIVEANIMAVKILEYPDAESMLGASIQKHNNLSPDNLKRMIRKFIQENYVLHGFVTTETTYNNNKVKVENHLIGVVENKKLVSAWGVLKTIGQ